MLDTTLQDFQCLCRGRATIHGTRPGISVGKPLGDPDVAPVELVVEVLWEQPHEFTTGDSLVQW